MALIRGHQSEQQAQKAIVLDLGDLNQQAMAILAKAHAEADAIVAAGKERALEAYEEAKKQGHATGFEEGKAEGYQAGEEAGRAVAQEASAEIFAQIQEAWVNAAGQWDEMRMNMIHEAQQTLLELSVKMAEQIVHRVCVTDPTIIQDQVDAAIAYVVRPCDVTIKINPGDRVHLDAVMPKLLDQLKSATHVEVVDDALITRGGCIVDYGRGRIDATIETQVKQIVEAVLPAPHANDAAGAVDAVQFDDVVGEVETGEQE